MKTRNNGASVLSRNQSRRGAALVIVMGISLCLVTIALFFCDSMLVEYRASDYGMEGEQAQQAISGAARYIKYVLDNSETPGYLPGEDTFEYEEVMIEDAAFWLIGRDYEESFPDEDPVFGLISESGKLNINTANSEMLESLPGITSEMAAAIIDWRDPDSETTTGGAESDYYLLLDEGYNAKNGPFESIEELRLVRDCNMEILFGEDVNVNGVLDPYENDGDENYPPDNADGVLDCGLAEYLTVFSREPNKRDDGSERINIQTQRDELNRFLEETFGGERSQQMMSALGDNPQNMKSVLEFYIRARLTPEEFLRIHDALTVAEGEYIEGLVNINTASEQVLICVPGIDDESARLIVSSRQDKTSEERQSLAWIAGVLEASSCIEAGPHLTTRTYQFRLDVAALGRNGHGYRRDLMIMDTSEDNANVIYRKNLQRQGWALGKKVREEFPESGDE